MQNTERTNENGTNKKIDLPHILQEVNDIAEQIQDKEPAMELLGHSKYLKDSFRYVSLYGLFEPALVNGFLKAELFGNIMPHLPFNLEISFTKEGEQPYALINGEKSLLSKTFFQHQKQGPFPNVVQAFVDNPWLREHQIVIRLICSRIIDMDRPDEFFKFFDKTDIMIFLTNALAALTKSEVQLIKECDERNIPYLIGISMLQMVNEDERESVVDYITNYIAEHFKRANLIEGNLHDGFLSDSVIYQRVTELFDTLNLNENRLQFFLSRLVQYLIQTRNLLIGKQNEKTEKMHEIKQQEIKEKNKINMLNDNWSIIANILAEKRQGIELYLRNHLAKNRQTTTETLLFEISRSMDPKTTWERDLPYFINRELQQTAERINNGAIQKQIADTLQWLRDEVSRKFNIKIVVSQPEVVKRENQRYEPKELPLMNTQKWRTNAKFGNAVTLLGVGTIFVSAPIGGIVVASSIIYQALVDKHITSVGTKDKEKIKTELFKVVETIELQYIIEFSEKLKKSFDEILGALKLSQSNWLKEKISGIETEAAQKIKNANDVKVDHALKQVNRILAEIL